MRANSDAIAVGVQTALADNPQLTARTEPPPRVNPTRVVFDRSARLSAESFLAKTAREAPTLLVTSSRTSLPADLERLGVEAIRAHDLGEALNKLHERGIASMMVEGGAGLAASFLASELVDRLTLFQAPVVLGDGSLNAFSGVASHDIDHAPRFRLIESRVLGDDVMTVYAPKPH
jgi:diaminohydroxyphosphoribosylaminopyrimidine deaminase/5-amino-6-(5-phosphoribosylamino)uracil reductase